MSSLRIVHLYPHELNVYGDTGNVMALKQRAQDYGLDVELINVSAGDPLPNKFDLLLSGGGQDRHQVVVQADLKSKADQLRSARDDGVPMLLICGSYQLFGNSFIDGMGQTVEGIGLIDMQTISAGRRRIVGNIAIDTDNCGRLIGYENHGGRTILGPGVSPFGKVVLGTGNNDHRGDHGEGARVDNLIGTYLHGPIIPRSPQLADHLLQLSLSLRGDQLPSKNAVIERYDTLADSVVSRLSKRFLSNKR